MSTLHLWPTTAADAASPETSPRRCCSFVAKLASVFTISNAHVALAVMCACAFVQNVLVGGANNAILTTIERAYYMTSLESALFLNFYDITNILASPLVGYFGDRARSKPRVIAFSMLGMSLGSLIMLLPEFISDDSSTSSLSLHLSSSSSSSSSAAASHTSSSYLCQSTTMATNRTDLTTNSTQQAIDNSRSVSSRESRLINNMKYVFYAANGVLGVSSVALYTTSIAYVESMFEKEKVHMRQGAYYAIGAIGVAVGMLVTGNFLNLDSAALLSKRANTPSSFFFSTQQQQQDQMQQQYASEHDQIGAWWMIYAIGAVCSGLLAALVFRFSSSLSLPLPSKVVTAMTTTAKQSDEEQAASPSPPLSFASHMRHFARQAKRILSNPVFVLIVIATTSETLLIKGFTSYLTKYFEYNYRLPAGTATIIAGLVGGTSLIGGALLGAWLVKRFRWRIVHCAKFIACMLLSTSALFLAFAVHCPQERYIPAHAHATALACHCDTNQFQPVCAPSSSGTGTGFLFQTPCAAGCSSADASSAQLYANCTWPGLDSAAAAVVRRCARPDPHCFGYLAFVCAVGFVVLFLSSSIIMPLLRVILESVDAENQSLALGIRSLLTKAFGNIPGPVLMAAIIDRACVQWTTRGDSSTASATMARLATTTSNSGGGGGSKTCRLYNNAAFSFGLGVFGATVRLVSAVFALATFLLITRNHHHADNSASSSRTATTTPTTTNAKSDNNIGSSMCHHEQTGASSDGEKRRSSAGTDSSAEEKMMRMGAVNPGFDNDNDNDDNEETHVKVITGGDSHSLQHQSVSNTLI